MSTRQQTRMRALPALLLAVTTLTANGDSLPPVPALSTIRYLADQDEPIRIEGQDRTDLRTGQPVELVEQKTGRCRIRE